MTEQTALAVRDALVFRGVPATFEYPGYVSIYITPNFVLNVNDNNDTVDVDVMVDDQSLCAECIESTIPAHSDDVERITDFVAVTYTQAMEVLSASKSE